MSLNIATVAIQMLTQADETIAVAESLTGGGPMAALTSVPGASAVFRGEIVSYMTVLKEFLLQVDTTLIAREGVIHGKLRYIWPKVPAKCPLSVIMPQPHETLGQLV